MQQSPWVWLALCILISSLCFQVFCFLALLKICSYKNCSPGQHEACKSNSDIWHTSLHVCMEELQQFTPLCRPLLAVSQQTGDHSRRLGKKNTEWPKAWLWHAPWSKIPTKPNRAPHPEQATATDTAPKLWGKYLVKTETTHCQRSKRLSNKLFIQKHPRSLHGQVLHCFCYNAQYKFKMRTVPSPFPRSQVKETWMSD